MSLIFYNCICVCTSISIICILFVCHVTNLALWLRYFNKLTYLLTYNGGGMHFDNTGSSLSCLRLSIVIPRWRYGGYLRMPLCRRVYNSVFLFRILIAGKPQCRARAPLFSPLSIYFLNFSPFYFSLSFIGFPYFLLLSIPSLSTRIVPLLFQAGGRRKRPNLGLVCCVLCLCYLYS